MFSAFAEWRVFARKLRGKDFLLKGGKTKLAISKERKQELVDHYTQWIKRSQTQIVITYTGINQKDIDALRAKLRDNGGEVHIVKNTLAELAFKQAGMPLPAGLFEGSTAVGFGFQDAPAFAKAVLEAAKGSDFLKVKGGYLDKKPITPDGVKSLADLPPLPVMRAQLLGVLNAPASRLVRTLAEPARQIAAVLKAHAEPAAAEAAA